MKKIIIMTMVALAYVSFLNMGFAYNNYKTITIDGTFSDWSSFGVSSDSSDQVDIAPNEVEGTGGLLLASKDSALDIVDIWECNDANYLYISVSEVSAIDQGNPVIRKIDLAIDTDDNNLTGYRNTTWASGLEKMVQLSWTRPYPGTFVGNYQNYSGTGNNWSWTTTNTLTRGVDYQWGTWDGTPNSRCEVKIDRTWLGSPPDGTQFRIVVMSEQTNPGSFVDQAPTTTNTNTYEVIWAANPVPVELSQFEAWE